jgi:hypothetical protein
MAITKMSNSGIASTGTEKYNDMLAGNAPYEPSGFYSIASAVGTGSSATITFSSIPQTFQSLQLRIMARDIGAGTSTGNATFIRLNANTGNNYSWHATSAGGGSITNENYTYGATGGNGYMNAVVAAGGNPSGVMGVGIINIDNYASTSQRKTIRVLAGTEQISDGRIVMSSINFNSTGAITQIDIQGSQASFATSTVISLYGIKG